MPRLEDLVRPGLVFPDLTGSTSEEVLRELSERLASRGVVDDASGLYDKLMEREELGSTGIGAGVAIPHCKLEDLDEVFVAVGTVPDGVEFGAVDGRPVQLFFLVISPVSAPAAHLQSLASISRWVKEGPPLERIIRLDDPDALCEAIRGNPVGEPG